MKGAFAAFLMLLACAGLAQPKEEQIKAAFLQQFVSFVEWPPEALRADAPISIGVFGATDVAAELEKLLAGRKAEGRPVRLRRLQEGDPLADVHMVFLGRGEAARLRELMRLAPAQPLLVVCDWDGALEQGAVVNFLRLEGRVRFEVALDAAGQRKLRISPRMLGAAQSVKPGRR